MKTGVATEEKSKASCDGERYSALVAAGEGGGDSGEGGEAADEDAGIRDISTKKKLCNIPEVAPVSRNGFSSVSGIGAS